MILSKAKVRIVLVVVFLLGLSSPTLAQSNNACANPDLIQSTAVAITSAVSTRVVLSTDTEKKIVICGLNLTLVGAATANTVVVQYGTGATCGTGTTVLSGGFTASTVVGSSTVIPIGPYVSKSVPAANSLCLLTTTADAVKGIVSYVVQ